MPRVKKSQNKRKRATQPVTPLEAPPPMRSARVERIQRPSKPIVQPLDPPEFEGSALALIRERWTAAGSLLPTPAESEHLLSVYRATHAKVEAIREELHDALGKESAAIVELARAFGGNSLRIDGVVHDFASRGDTIFFRRKSVKVIDP